MRDDNHLPSFETSRLRLRALKTGDEPFLARLDSDADTMRYIHSGPFSYDKALRNAAGRGGVWRIQSEEVDY